MIPIDPNQTRDYVLRDDRDLPEAERPVFVIRTLTARMRAILTDNMTTATTAGVVHTRTGSQVLDKLRACLIGWRNMVNPVTDAPIEFERTSKRVRVLGLHDYVITDDCLDVLPPEVVDELERAIEDTGRLTVDEGNGSGSRSG